MLCHEHVFKYRHALPQADVLERARDAELCDLIRRRRENLARACQRVAQEHLLFCFVAGIVLACVEQRVFALIELFHLAGRMVADHWLVKEFDEAVRRLVYAGDAVEGRGLSGAVRADERHDLPLGNVQREVVDGDDAAELHRDILHAEDVLTHLLCPPQLRSFLPFSLACQTDPAARARP